MSQYEKLLLSIMGGTKDKSILFAKKGGHFTYTKDGVEEIINIQPVGDKAKIYQVKQVHSIILKYWLGGGLA